MGLAPHPEFNIDNAQTLRLPYALAIAAGSALSLCLLIVRGEAMKAKRLLTALLLAVLVSGLFTFWLSRRVAARVNVRAEKAAICCRGEDRSRRANY